MFFQETTPDTSGYMIAGYTITFIVLAVYVASIAIRNRNLRQDMEMLKQMESNQPEPVVASAPKTKPKKKPAKPITRAKKKK